jgi:hypothetical protein
MENLTNQHNRIETWLNLSKTGIKPFQLSFMEIYAVF